MLRILPLAPPRRRYAAPPIGMPDAIAATRDWRTALCARPAVTAAAVFIGGILLHPILPHRPGTFLMLSMIAAVVAVRLRTCGAACAALIALAIGLGGAAGAQIQAFQYPRDHI